MRTIKRDIVGVFIFSGDGHILLGKSHKGGVYQDVWIVPGGGIEAGETLLEAVKREALEEVGIDISDYKIEQIEGAGSGVSKKTLRDTGEEVLVKMTFFDFVAHADKPAAELDFSCNDDIVLAKWHPVASLAELSITEPMKRQLQKLGYIH